MKSEAVLAAGPQAAGRCRLAAAILLTLAAFAWRPAGEVAAGTAMSAGQPPATLAETGLYADPVAKAVRTENLPYAPQYPLYSDGAAKARWIALPAGAAIDAADPDHWVFPVGTRIWKEFSFGGRRIETRYMELREDGWLYATYLWDAEESAASLAPLRGIRGVAAGEGRRHDVPGRYDCLSCHQGQPQEVLGFGALQLSPKRDPGALHREDPPAGAVDLAALEARGLLRGLPARFAAPEIPGSPRERAALGYLHVNCGTCHNPASPLRGVELDLSFSLERPRGALPPALATSLGVPTRKRMGAAPAAFRIAAGDPEGSAILQRMNVRDPNTQMPTLGTQTVDAEAVAFLAAWIREDLERR